MLRARLPLLKRLLILLSIPILVVSHPAEVAAVNEADRIRQSIIWADPSCEPSASPTGSPASGDLASQNPTEGEFATTAGTNGLRMIIVHTTEGDSVDGAKQALRQNNTSYHTIVDQGGAEFRLLPDEAIANGAKGANNDSLHVSLVGKANGGSHFDPDSPQLQTLSKRIAEWSTKHNIPIEKVSGPGILNGGTSRGVAGHYDVAQAAGYNDRTDPGESFPWAEVLANARASVGASALSNNTGRSAPGGDTGTTSGTGSGSSQSSVECCPTSNTGASAQSSGDGGGCGEKAGDSAINQGQVWSYFNKKFVEAGYTPDEAEKATAGIMGNWRQESGFNPDRHNAPNPGAGCQRPDGSAVPGGLPELGVSGMGIAQWCGDRQKKLADFAGGEDPSCLGVQLEFAWSEMEDRNLIEGMKGVDARRAASIFNLGGNGAQGFEIGADDGARQGHAEDLYAEYTGQDPGSLNVRSASGNGCDSDSSSSPLSGSVAEAAKKAGENGGCYDPAGGHGTLEDLQERIDNNFSQGFGVDCSGFARAMLYTGTGVDPGSFTTGDLMAGHPKFTDVADRCDAKPGDLAVSGDHVEVITEVNPDCTFKTVGAHTTGCSPDNGIYPAAFQGDKVVRYNPGAVSV